MKNTDDNKICGYCLDLIKSSEEPAVCNFCGSVYHKECWIDNKGCAVYGCRNAKTVSKDEESGTVNNKIALIERLIRKKKFYEAINECNEILNTDKDNSEAKSLKNKASVLINTKIKLLEDGEKAFNKNDFITAKIYFQKYIDYAEDAEKDYILLKIQYIEEKIPREKLKRISYGIFISVTSLLIIASLFYLFYFHLFLKEEREFAKIEKDDNHSEIRTMENQLLRYEYFLNKYPESNLRNNAESKINNIALNIADLSSNDDWRSAYTYLKKADAGKYTKTYRDISEKIFSKARKEMEQNISGAKKLDASKNYQEASFEIDRAINIIEFIGNKEFLSGKKKLLETKSLLSNKISLSAKLKNISREIEEIKDELSTEGDILNYGNLESFEVKVIKINTPGIYIVRNIKTKKIIALKTKSGSYQIGDEINIMCFQIDKIKVTDDYGNEILIPLYSVPAPSFSGDLDYKKDAVLRRLSYLKSEKSKIDSLLNIGI